MGHPTALMLYGMVAILCYQLGDVRFSWQYDRVFDAFGYVGPSQATSDSQDSIGIKIGIEVVHTAGLLQT